jgi:hypothetical protein
MFEWVSKENILQITGSLELRDLTFVVAMYQRCIVDKFSDITGIMKGIQVNGANFNVVNLTVLENESCGAGSDLAGCVLDAQLEEGKEVILVDGMAVPEFA